MKRLYKSELETLYSFLITFVGLLLIFLVILLAYE